MKFVLSMSVIGWLIASAFHYKIIEVEFVPNDLHVIINKPAWLNTTPIMGEKR